MKQITFPIILVLFFLTSIQSGYSQLNCYSLQAPTFSIPGMEKITENTAVMISALFRHRGNE